MPLELTKRRFTADEYQRMGEAGILSGRDRVELIDGEVVAMTAIGSRHSAAVDRTTRTLVVHAGEKAIVRVQGTVRLNLFNQPQPDLVLLRPRKDFYAAGHPGPADIRLIIEIAESSIDYDREVKSLLYARMGVHEYWLADLNEDVVTCYSAPERGLYQNVRYFRGGEYIAPALFADCIISTDDLLAN